MDLIQHELMWKQVAGSRIILWLELAALRSEPELWFFRWVFDWACGFLFVFFGGLVLKGRQKENDHFSGGPLKEKSGPA